LAVEKCGKRALINPTQQVSCLELVKTRLGAKNYQSPMMKMEYFIVGGKKNKLW